MNCTAPIFTEEDGVTAAEFQRAKCVATNPAPSLFFVSEGNGKDFSGVGTEPGIVEGTPVVCAWCGKQMRVEQFAGFSEPTHGICPPCRAKFFPQTLKGATP